MGYREVVAVFRSLAIVSTTCLDSGRVRAEEGGELRGREGGGGGGGARCKKRYIVNEVGSCT